MRFEVPQFIDIEDKIFGPLTWRQFLYMGGGIGMGVVLFLTTPFLVFLFIGLPLILLALALSFYKVNNRSFSIFLESMFNYFMSNRRYNWAKKEDVVYRDHRAKTSNETPADTGVGSKDISSMASRLELEAMQKTDT